ncbi:uncharacterized protein LOC116192800 [Punica granatum]|uniref:Uncharacterized protein LOC116192800 n=1 Tax=Punica granatum TaxID=22663 RepID=A0A6P8C6D1_PUNGR|nr:uncharacterized protein LOC116192800 [Punica granatum]
MFSIFSVSFTFRSGLTPCPTPSRTRLQDSVGPASPEVLQCIRIRICYEQSGLWSPLIQRTFFLSSEGKILPQHEMFSKVTSITISDSYELRKSGYTGRQKCRAWFKVRTWCCSSRLYGSSSM